MAISGRIRINRKLAVILATVAVAGTIGLFVAHRVQTVLSLGRSRRVGLEARDGQNWSLAAAHLQHYLQSTSDDRAVLEALAESLIEGYGQRKEAYELRERLLRIDDKRFLFV